MTSVSANMGRLALLLTISALLPLHAQPSPDYYNSGPSGSSGSSGSDYYDTDYQRSLQKELGTSGRGDRRGYRDSQRSYNSEVEFRVDPEQRALRRDRQGPENFGPDPERRQHQELYDMGSRRDRGPPRQRYRGGRRRLPPPPPYRSRRKNRRDGGYGVTLPSTPEPSTTPTPPTRPTRPTRPTKPTKPTQPTPPTRPTRPPMRRQYGRRYPPRHQQQQHRRRGPGPNSQRPQPPRERQPSHRRQQDVGRGAGFERQRYTQRSSPRGGRRAYIL